MLKPEVKINNKWKAHHENLNDNDKRDVTTKICKSLEWSVSTFHRRKDSPATLKGWEKMLVAAAYRKEVEELFTEN